MTGTEPHQATSTRPADTAQVVVDPFEAMETLRTALDEAGITLPGLWVNSASSQPRLIELGEVRADVALQLAHALRRRSPQA
ncbi:hypothetical protein STRCI_008665 [Streptomyces cinnabarinus]|uniref:Uncharacterized protein n=1 Tax=Streptomyces cinnabarinus TaxID=67287 RepID=A0ABY7KUL4_9ACTN|nr:hypothetical protein [Streptomyces cinnabarinus]WAZ27355.1 hypothetical protein STRCI_000010 [Streptomyces cinnabarinus]WAZ27368.1 hypothetical protein STRCI_008665 [Streptomyces cinnabarinus]